MNRAVEFLFDYGSPFSYFASLKVEDVARRHGASVIYTPILLGALLKATSNSSPMTVPAKGRYMATDLQRWSVRIGVPFQGNHHAFLSNTLRLMRGAVAAQTAGCFLLYHPAIYRAVWADARNLGDDAILGEVLENAGILAAPLLARIERQEVKDQLRQNTDRAVARGAFGAPTFFVGDEMFWGNDRLVLVEEALQRLA